MTTNKTHIKASGGLRRKLLVLLMAAAAAILAARDGTGSALPASPTGIAIVSRATGTNPGRAAYGWPLKPFNRAHPVRAYLNDPRILGSARSFHFGIDIGIPLDRLTPVYAVAAGTVRIVNSEALIVQGTHTFAYWHVTAAVRSGQFVGRHQYLGRSLENWNHIHFAEFVAGSWINPLRPGALGPYADWTLPTLRKVTFATARTPLDPNHVSGTTDIVLNASDTAAGITPAPWPVTPAVIRWRILRANRAITAWRTVMSSSSILDNETFESVYAAGTRQNHPGHPGTYRFYLAKKWASTSLPDGSYTIEIRASDIRANTVVGHLPFTVANNL
jgi:hypothetical protein